MERINYSFAKQVGIGLVCLVNLNVPPFLNVGNLFAQSNEMYQPASFPPSPEVSALAKFADIPISRYNGLPNTSIPLYAQATDFRKWATTTLNEFIIKGFVLDDECLKQGRSFCQDYFDELLERIQEIRAF